MRNNESESNHRRSPSRYSSILWRLILVSVCLAALWTAIDLVAKRTSQVVAAAFPQGGGSSADGLWKILDQDSISRRKRRSLPRAYQKVGLNKTSLLNLLKQAPLEVKGAAMRSEMVITIPMPDGTFARFNFEESSIMEPSLAAKFPEIRTYRGQGIDDPTATTRFDWTPKGFHAIVLSASGTVYVNPYDSNSEYISYYKRDNHKGEPFQCLLDSSEEQLTQSGGINPKLVTNGGTLHTYRLAVAATAEYTDFHGGTVALALAEINTTMNRVNGIYERELSVRMVLVANETDIIYTGNPMDDPYTDGDAAKMIKENQENLDAEIQNANYDIGHVFGAVKRDGRGRIGSVCETGKKAKGATGHESPTGNDFDVDYVAHEMGHQFGANHTFNGTTGSCMDARTASAAYEPGSGSTIMAYAGICGVQGDEDLQDHSDDYFHVKSLEQIVAFVNGNTCDAETANGNITPTVNAGPDFTIPISTPFVLTATGGDANGDALTFVWEEYDLGTESPPSTDDGSRPIFRSITPDLGLFRTFPRLSDIFNDTSTFGESLPTTTRTMNFQVTARDNRAGGGAVNSASMKVNVTDSSGPFAVTQPNSPVVWTVGETRTVTWAVANTTAAPVSCANVRITLLTDGIFPTVLLASTPNDGTQTVTVPDRPSIHARIKVEAVDNIFFDISNPDFIVNRPPVITCPANIVTPTDPGLCSAAVNFVASASDTDAVNVICTSPPGTAFPKGTTTVQCTATDTVGATDTCSFTVTVNDAEAPIITCPADITVGNDPGLCSATVNPGTATATDNCAVASIVGTRSDGQPLNAPYPVGTTIITWKATDTSNNMITCPQTIVVNDVEPPVITASVESTCLWPPGHNLINVGFSLAVSDNCTLASAIVVDVKATSDERPEIQTQGDGNFSPDAVITGLGVNRVVRLRAERMGGGDGRVYLIRISATDQYNNTSLRVLQVGVPKNQNPPTLPADICAVDSRPVSGGNAPDGGFFAESPPALVIGRKQ